MFKFISLIFLWSLFHITLTDIVNNVVDNANNCRVYRNVSKIIVNKTSELQTSQLVHTHSLTSLMELWVMNISSFTTDEEWFSIFIDPSLYHVGFRLKIKEEGYFHSINIITNPNCNTQWGDWYQCSLSMLVLTLEKNGKMRRNTESILNCYCFKRCLSPQSPPSLKSIGRHFKTMSSKGTPAKPLKELYLETIVKKGNLYIQPPTKEQYFKAKSCLLYIEDNTYNSTKSAPSCDFYLYGHEPFAKDRNLKIYSRNVFDNDKEYDSIFALDYIIYIFSFITLLFDYFLFIFQILKYLFTFAVIVILVLHKLKRKEHAN
ncbi:hypothetical protein QKT26_gp20 [Carcinus maenas nudivirus]|uniref:Uncharacterized protein n=1 Tax=Carcinus maenas nudivirus TaxID=2880837 RepID=A0AAE8Y0D8_9VIRU|nr:hypothetical protein QKT26_gp20 [Carcinus maenas nudivirus]UBZ25610.1 hypothetical protein CmNV_020 [Carcinus maenas nudivirus]